MLKVKPPVTYCVEVVIKIGKKVNLAPFTGVASSVGYIRSPENLVTIIPLKYWPKIKDTSRYHLEVEQIGGLGMLKIIIKGHDRGVERGLKELVDALIDEHRVLSEISIAAYKNLLVKLEKDCKTLKKEIVIISVSLREMKKKEQNYLVGIGSTDSKQEIGSDRSAFLNMLYLKTIDRERELSSTKENLRSIQKQLFTHRLTLGNIAEYKTEKFGEIKTTVINPKVVEKSRNNTIPVTGVAGLIISLFIAFFMEYIEESKSRRKGK